MFRHPFTEVLQNPGFEGTVLRLGGMGGRVSQRSDKAQQTFTDHLWRQSIGIHLERIFGVGPVGVDKRATDMLSQATSQQALNQGPDLGLTEMQEVPGHIKGKPVHLIGPTETSRLLLFLEQPIRHAGHVISRAQTGQTGTDDDDHGSLRAGSGAGSRRSMVCAGRDISMRLSQTAAMTNSVIVAPTRTSAGFIGITIIPSASPPRTNATP